jgi:CIC family chloride channel protein
MRLIEVLELGYLQKWGLIGIIVGIIAGLGAIVFYTLLEYGTYYFLGYGASFFPPKSGVGPEALNWIPPENPLLLVAVITLGGLASGLIVYTFAPEAEGHGTDAAIASFHRAEGKVRARIPLIKTIASVLTIGSGGSAGREGPTAQVSAGFGSIVAGLLKLGPRDRRIALAIGVGAGIGSIFKAPLGGAILAAEILYIRDFETEALIPGLIASTVGYIIFCSYDGYEPLFMFPGVQISALQIPFFMFTGLICGIFGLVYVFMFYRTHELFSNLFKRIGLPPHFKPALGAFITGLLVVFLMKILDPAVGLGALGMGYGFLQLAMYNLLPLEVMLGLAFVKIVTTSLTIGSGGSGGVFAPGLVVGGMVGGAVGMMLHLLFPSIIPQDVVPAFVVIGMIALFGGISKAPIAIMVMICEMTNYMLLFPAMAAVAISYIITGKHTIYKEQAETRVESPAHRSEMLIDVLETIEVRDAMTPAEKVVAVSPKNAVLDLPRHIEKTGHMGYPVVDGGRLVGIITFEDVEKIPVEKRGETKVGEVMARNLIVTYPDESLEVALKKLADNNIGRLPVVAREDERELLGILTRSDIMRAHAREIRRLIPR